jgi:hypothetical protein
VGIGGGGTLDFAVSIAEISTQAGFLVALAIIATVLAGRRKPARPWQRAPRGSETTPLAVAVDRRGRRVLVPVDRQPTRLENRLGPLRLIGSTTALGVIAVVAGAVGAIGIAAGVAWVVTTVTGLLR